MIKRKMVLLFFIYIVIVKNIFENFDDKVLFIKFQYLSKWYKELNEKVIIFKLKTLMEKI